MLSMIFIYWNKLQNEGNDYENKRLILRDMILHTLRIRNELNMKQESFSMLTMRAERAYQVK